MSLKIAEPAEVFPGEQTAVAVAISGTDPAQCRLLQDGVDIGQIGGAGAAENERILGPFAQGVETVSFSVSCPGITSNTVSVKVVPPNNAHGKRVFDVSCSAQPQNDGFVDPVVAPGGPSGHVHNFAGNPSVTPNSTYDSMYAAGEAAIGTPSQGCLDVGDFAAYWKPQLNYSLDGGATWTPLPLGTSVHAIHAYYRGEKQGGNVQIMPPDFAIVSYVKDSPDAGKVFTCGDDKPRWPTPHACGPAERLNSHLSEVYNLPEWWDCGPREPYHGSNVSFKHDAQHPCRVPNITLIFDLGTIVQLRQDGGICDDVTCSNVRFAYGPLQDGSYVTDLTSFAHLDFFNGWDLLRQAHNFHECENQTNDPVLCHDDVQR